MGHYSNPTRDNLEYLLSNMAEKYSEIILGKRVKVYSEEVGKVLKEIKKQDREMYDDFLSLAGTAGRDSYASWGDYAEVRRDRISGFVDDLKGSREDFAKRRTDIDPNDDPWTDFDRRSLVAEVVTATFNKCDFFKYSEEERKKCAEDSAVMVEMLNNPDLAEDTLEYILKRYQFNCDPKGEYQLSLNREATPVIDMVSGLRARHGGRPLGEKARKVLNCFHKKSEVM